MTVTTIWGHFRGKSDKIDLWLECGGYKGRVRDNYKDIPFQVVENTGDEYTFWVEHQPSRADWI